MTWKSPYGKTVNEIYHILANSSMRTSIMDTRVMRGGDEYSDHYLVRSKIKLKLLRVERLHSRRAKFDINKLRNDDIKKEFDNEVERRYQALRDTDDDEM